MAIPAMPAVFKLQLRGVALKQQILNDKDIILANDPNEQYMLSNGTKSFYQRELDFLSDNGYTFEELGDGIWKAVK